MEKVDLLKNNGIKVNEALDFWGDLDSYNENLLEFKESLNEKLSTLEYYKNNNDANNYAILAHSLKSESKYLGFMNEAEVFLAHELKGKENDMNYINNNFATLKQTINNIQSLLEKYFNDDNKKNILIADDSNIILNFLEKSIPQEYNLLKAKNGNEALNIINNNKLYAILLDLNMPQLNGFEVLTYLKEKGFINQIPVIVITGDDSSTSIEKVFNYGVLDVLNKPFKTENIERIIATINHFYDQNNY